MRVLFLPEETTRNVLNIKQVVEETAGDATQMTQTRMVQKIERLLSSRFTIVIIENTPKVFSVLDRIIR